MRQLLTELMGQFDPEAIPRGTPREVQLPRVPRKADAIIGMRRSGKTWRLFQEIHAVLDQGARPHDILYLSFEDERLQPMQTEDLHWITEIFNTRRNAESRNSEGEKFFFFDEVQNVPGWERWVRRLLDHETPHIVITGSSGKLLSQEIATSLRGRSLPTELLPFSFSEILHHQGVEIPKAWPPAAEPRREFERQLQRYLHDGGFPEVQGKSAALRVRILQDYIHVVLLRDVAERHSVENLAPLRYLQRTLLARPSNRFSVHKLFNDLKSQGVSVGKNTLYEYLDHLEDAYLLFPMTIHSKSLRVRQSNPRKVYPVDTGLAAAVSFEAAGDLGHLLETLVYLELRRRSFEMGWVRTGSGYEVDFIAHGLTGERLLVQVAADMSSKPTRNRELRALEEAMAEYRFDSAVVVTMWEQETIEVGSKTIRVVPAWRWLLEDRGI